MSEVPTHAVKAVIRNEAGDILFLRRNAANRADMRASWDLPGGLVEVGEDDEQALRREIPEETGRTIADVEQKLGEWSFYRPYDGATVEVANYRVTLAPGDEIVLSDEHTAVMWATRSLLQSRGFEVKDLSIFSALGINE